MWYWHKAGLTAQRGEYSENLTYKYSCWLVVAAVVLVLSGCDRNSFKPDLSEGGQVPASVNKIVGDVKSWKEICSMDIADNLHRWRISDLRAANKPFLIVFGTPQHCTMCVDQLVRVSGLQEKYGERFAFLHSDGYRENPIWVAWGIKGEPWTYIVDGKGKVRALFPGPTDVALMEAEIDKLLVEKGS